MFWPKLTNHKIKQTVFDALSKNINYRSESILGVPGTYLDTEIFYDDAPFLREAPFLSTLVANPNHIGCHTMDGEHESLFTGTQELEKKLIQLCAEEIFKATPHEYDGYVASGGTEANIEALWIYRNYFEQVCKANYNEISVLCSEDTHYSIHKASNLLNIDCTFLPVDKNSRQIILQEFEASVNNLIKSGKKYLIVVLNLSTTMFGSVDDIDTITNYLNLIKVPYKLHIDAAYGGFIYPFTNSESKFNFKNKNISSFSIDGHKMLQSPYGTGILLVRKNHIEFVCNEKATYVKGKDYTLVGSRSGANAVCVWMILHAHGSVEWTMKMKQLVDKTTNFCHSLDNLGVEYYRNPFLNIVAIKSQYISESLAKQFILVPDTHDGNPDWYKIVMMPHVKQGVLDNFLNRLNVELISSK